MRVDYSDEQVRLAVYHLFDTSFDRLSTRIALAESVGAVWHEVSTAFVDFIGDVAVSHVGVIEIPMVVAGVQRTVAGVHAVCTRPGHRGQGRSNAVLGEALRHIDDRYDLAVLATEIPGFYEPFGFRVVEESLFEVPRASAGAASKAVRAIEASDPDDLDLVYALLRERQPVSNVFASLDPGWLFLIDEVLTSWGLRRLHFAPELDAILAYEVRNGTLCLLDIVAREIPPLDAVLKCIPDPFERVTLLFTPDRVWDGELLLLPSDPSDRLMVRGDFPVREPCALTPLARC
jgi:GNAT superfamily N-acetyltransferase